MKMITVFKAGVMDAGDDAQNSRTTPAPDRLGVRVKYVGVGFADVMAVRGGYPLAPKRPFIPGYEFFGHVEKACASPPAARGKEPAWQPELVPGTRVVGMLPRMGAYREWINVDSRLVAPVPPELDDEKAAALPLNYLTAYALMHRCVQLEKGRSFLIHGAAGGVGTAALEMARVLGLRAFGTASAGKHDLVRSLGGIPLNRQHDAWIQELMRLQPNGVDAVFDAFGAESLRKSWRVLSPNGTLVCYGLSPSIDGGTADFLKGLAYLGYRKVFSRGRQVWICGTPGIIGADPEWFRSAMMRILEWARIGTFKPIVAGVIPWDKAAEAHRELAEGRVKGKLLLSFST